MQADAVRGIRHHSCRNRCIYSNNNGDTHLQCDEVQDGADAALATRLAVRVQQLQGFGLPELDADGDGELVKILVLLKQHLAGAADVHKIGAEGFVDLGHDAAKLRQPLVLQPKITMKRVVL